MRIKRVISIEDWNETPATVKEFIILWKQKNGYPNESPLVDLVQAMELLVDVTRNKRKDDSDGRFFNNIFVNYESVIGWDGDHLLDALYYEVVQSIKHLFAARRR